MEIASHIELTQDPFPKGTPGVKAPETPKGHPGLNFFQSWPQYSIESVSRAPGPLKSWIYSSLSTPCRSTLSQGSSKMKCSRNFQSIKHYLHGAGERSRNAGGDAVKGVFTMPNMMGSLQTKVKVWVCQVSPGSGYGGLDPLALSFVEFQAKQANSNAVLYPSSLSLHHETSN